MATPEIDVRPFAPGDEAGIFEGLRACFGFEPDLARWRHLFLENPAGPSIILLAIANGAVLSHTAILPRRIVAFGRDGLAGHVVDSMTLPAVQRRGLKTRLALAGQATGWARGFRAIYSFANEQALPGNLKHEGRRPVCALPLMVRPLRPFHAALSVAGAVLGAGRLTLDTPDCAAAGPLADGATFPSSRPAGWAAPAFDARHTQLFREAEGLPPIAVIRDAAQLDWRYATAPGAPYLQCDVCRGGAVVATAVVRSATLVGLRTVIVMEWLWAAGARDEGVRVMREALAYARAAGAEAVAALVMPGTLQRRLLLRLGFVGIPAAIIPKTVTLMVRGADADARWTEASSWYLTWGDGFVL